MSTTNYTGRCCKIFSNADLTALDEPSEQSQNAEIKRLDKPPPLTTTRPINITITEVNHANIKKLWETS